MPHGGGHHGGGGGHFHGGGHHHHRHYGGVVYTGGGFYYRTRYRGCYLGRCRYFFVDSYYASGHTFCYTLKK